MIHIYGPVPSRRLGFSLGVDVVPFKICSLDCIYCQLGRTTNKTIERKEYISADDVLKELKEKVVKKEHSRIDYITFSGSGEPTLHSKLGYMIEEIKKITSIPVAVITNGTLLYNLDVQEELEGADVVIPSLDAPDKETFKRINRPYPSLKFEKVISGIKNFSQNFKGKLWLEIMLVKKVNDSLPQIKKFAQIIKEIRCEKIQLNTPVRPSAEEFAEVVDFSFLQKVKSIFGEKCEIISEFKKSRQKICDKDIEDNILSMLRRRPVSLEDISNSLGISRNEVIKYVQILKEKDLIDSKIYNRKRYYYSR